MTYKFKYHPDNVIYKNGSYYKNYDNFMAAYPDFPLEQGKFFEYKNDGTLELIHNINGTFTHEIIKDLSPYENLIKAIGE